MNKGRAPQAEGYYALCYHYIRPETPGDVFSKLLGNSIGEFRRHLDALSRSYRFIGLEEAHSFSYGKSSIRGRRGMLITFDDGLADHWTAAQILAERGIRGTFFVPTCIIKDKLPANPTIIHYVLAYRRIGGFLAAYRDALEEYGLPRDRYGIVFAAERDDPWKTIAAIKTMLKYMMPPADARRVLLHIYRNTLEKDFPDALALMHLTEAQIRSMAAMGHSFGIHSHSHVSVAHNRFDGVLVAAEVIEPRRWLEAALGTPVLAFSYPFGEKKDCLAEAELVKKTKEYQLAFTVEKILNTRRVSPFELGRYMPQSTDTDKNLLAALAAIEGDNYENRDSHR